MSIQDSGRRSPTYTGTGQVREFAFGFKVFEEDQVSVYRKVSDDAEVELVPESDYDVSLESTGGTVTMHTAPANGVKLVIVSNIPYTQLLGLQNFGSFSPEDMNVAWDKNTGLIQQVRDGLDRAVKVPVISEKDPDKLLDELLAAGEAVGPVIPVLDDIKTVAGIAPEVAKTAEMEDSVKTVSGIATEVEKTAEMETDISAVGKNIDAIVKVSNNIDEIIGSGGAVEAAKEAAESADRAEAAAEAAVGQLHAVSYEAQELKTSERVQAKANIGADYFVNVKDFGAKGDGVTDDTEALRAAIATGDSVYIPKGVYVCTGELEVVTPGQVISGAGMGMGYRYFGRLSVTSWNDTSTILMKGTGPRRLRTRVKPRLTSSAPNDDPLSVAINIQAEGVVLRDFCVRLDVTVSPEALEACNSSSRTAEQKALVEKEKSNLGADWDVGVFSGSRTWGVYERVAVVGYFRQASFWMDFTQDPYLPRFKALDGSTYPQSNVINGNDGHNFFSCYTFGARWGLVWRGADSDNPAERLYDNTRDYYDELTGTTTKDHRGSFGGSDLNVFGCTFYGTSHHTRAQIYALELADPVADMGKGGGAMFVSGLAGNASGRCHGHRFIATRFAAAGPWRVCLGVTGRDTLINCIIDIEQICDDDGRPVTMDASNHYGPFWCSPYVYSCRLIGQQGNWYSTWMDPASRDLEVIGLDSYGGKQPYRFLARQLMLGFATEGAGTDSSALHMNSGKDAPGNVMFYSEGKLLGLLRQYASGTTFAYMVPGPDGTNIEKVAIRGGKNNTEIDYRAINSIVRYYVNTAFAIRIDDWDKDALFFRHEANSKYMNIDAPVRPAADNTYSLGTNSVRWSEVFSVTGAINTSDEREKTEIKDTDEALMRAWSRVRTRVFRFKDAVAKKGADAARLHVGVIAQEVLEAFSAEGLDATRYGLLCYDKWDDEYEDVVVVDTPEVLDDEGRIVTPEKSHVERRLVIPAGDRYGIRYEEALALECAYLRHRMESLEGRLSALENGAKP